MKAGLIEKSVRKMRDILSRTQANSTQRNLMEMEFQILLEAARCICNGPGSSMAWACPIHQVFKCARSASDTPPRIECDRGFSREEVMAGKCDRGGPRWCGVK